MNALTAAALSVTESFADQSKMSVSAVVTDELTVDTCPVSTVDPRTRL
jgi:hypothetical protein